MVSHVINRRTDQRTRHSFHGTFLSSKSISSEPVFVTPTVGKMVVFSIVTWQKYGSNNDGV